MLNDKQIAALPDPGKPDNMYELLDRVCEAIMAEPRRYDQNTWFYLYEGYIEGELPPKAPGCGTVGCRAGWISTLAARATMDGKELAAALYKMNYVNVGPNSTVALLATRLLGVGDTWDNPDEYEYSRAVGRLFAGDALASESGIDAIDEETVDTWNYNHRPGTLAHAEAGVRGIRAFMEKWETRLKSLPVVMPEL